MNTEPESQMIAIILAIVLLFVAIPFNVSVGMALWTWHVVPLGVKAISWWQTLGLMCVISLFRGRPLPRKAADAAELFDRSMANIWVPMVILVIGYVAKEMAK